MKRAARRAGRFVVFVCLFCFVFVLFLSLPRQEDCAPLTIVARLLHVLN